MRRGRRSAPAWWPGCATWTRSSPRRVAEGLGLRELPARILPPANRAGDLPASPALSILANGPDSFAGRKIGVLVTDGADAEALARAARRGRSRSRPTSSSSPRPSAASTSATGAGCRRPADRRRHLGALRRRRRPRVTGRRRARWPSNPAARDFVTDAYAHCKFIGYTSGAEPLLEAAGLQVSGGAPDDGLVSLDEHSARGLHHPVPPAPLLGPATCPPLSTGTTVTRR